MLTTYRGFFWINLGSAGTIGTRYFLFNNVKTLFYIPDIKRWIECKRKKETYYNFYGTAVNLVKGCLRHKRTPYSVYTKKALDYIYDNMFIILKQICTIDNATIVKTVKYSEETEYDKDPNYFVMISVYSQAGEYVGDPEFTLYLANKKIKPEKAAPNHNVCSIGFSEESQKWYGWSHRAMYGFGIGSKITKESCGYEPSNKEDFIQEHKKHYNDVDGTIVTPTRKGLKIKYHAQNNNGELVVYDDFINFPKIWGKGEWTAETLEDAKIMAKKFASSVS